MKVNVTMSIDAKVAQESLEVLGHGNRSAKVEEFLAGVVIASKQKSPEILELERKQAAMEESMREAESRAARAKLFEAAQPFIDYAAKHEGADWAKDPARRNLRYEEASKKYGIPQEELEAMVQKKLKAK